MLSILMIIIYMADVLDNVQFIAIGFGIVATIVAMVTLLIAAVSTPPSYNERYKSADISDRAHKGCIKYGRMSLVIGVVLLSFAAVLPSKTAVYTIAGVMCVDKLSKTEFAQDIGKEGKQLIKDVTSMIHSYAGKLNKNVNVPKSTENEDVPTSTENADKVPNEQ